MKRSNVPPEPIGSGNRWINWTADKQPTGRPLKVPYSPLTRRPIDVTKTDNGSTFQVAAKWKPNRLGLLVFPPLIVIDLDLAVSEKTGEVEPWAQEIVNRIDSYADQCSIPCRCRGFQIISTSAALSSAMLRMLPPASLDLIAIGRRTRASERPSTGNSISSPM